MSIEQMKAMEGGVAIDSLRAIPAEEILCSTERLRARFASSEQDREEVYRLRYEVFNLELAEGLATAHVTGMDTDIYDTVCEHLMVEDTVSGRVVGTYRLQHGSMAKLNHGYYSEQEFDFTPYEPLRSDLIEIGRACIHRDYRSLHVLMLLWRGLALYAKSLGARYMIGCSSLNSMDEATGSGMYHALKPFLVKEEWQTKPMAAYGFELQGPAEVFPDPPKLLKSYLAVGARICGAPALDLEFGTIDFLTLIDLDDLSAAARSRFFR